jgi:hypothetical protein
MGWINGVIAASILIAVKPRLVQSWDAHYVAILLIVVCCCYRRCLDEEGQLLRKLEWLLGCLMGILILTSPTFAPVYATWLAWELWRRKSDFLKKSLLPLVLLPVIIIAPWTIRNYLVFHSFPVIRDNFGLELSVSNNDCAQPTMSANFRSGCFAIHHPNGSVTEAEKVLNLGEVRYNELRLREALQWIQSHPVRFAKLSVKRFFAFWMPTNGRSLEYGITCLMTLLSGFGLAVLYRRDTKSAAVLISCLATYPLVYYIVQSSARYRYPIMWVTFLLGAVPITALAKRFWETVTDASSARPH